MVCVWGGRGGKTVLRLKPLLCRFVCAWQGKVEGGGLHVLIMELYRDGEVRWLGIRQGALAISYSSVHHRLPPHPQDAIEQHMCMHR